MGLAEKQLSDTGNGWQGSGTGLQDRAVVQESNMPYRVKGNVVQVKRGTRWVKLKKHPNAAKAQAHLRALRANVSHGTRRSRRGTKKK